MLIDLENYSTTNDYIAESFYPVPIEYTNGLYEVMHCYGSGYSLKNVEDKFIDTIQSNIKDGIIVEPTVVFFNADRMDAKPNYPELYFGVEIPYLINNKTIIPWIDEITFCGLVFYGNSKEECAKLFNDYIRKFPRAIKGIANCITQDTDNKVKCTVNLYAAYYDGNKMGFFGDTDGFRMVLYHEIMHKYQLLKSGGKVKLVDINGDRACLDVLNTYKFKKNKGLPIDDDTEGLYNLVRTIYYFSPRERAAFMGQQEVRFSKLDISSKREFYDELENSEINKAIKCANSAIEYLKNYCEGEGNTYVDKTLKHIITMLTGDDENGDIFKIVRKFIHIIQDEMSDMKSDLHNIAYWSLPDDVKKKIVEDYIEKY